MTKKRVIIISIVAIFLIATIVLIFQVTKKDDHEKMITELESEEVKQYLDNRFEANISDLIENFDGKDVRFVRSDPGLFCAKLLIKEGQEDAVEQIVASVMGKYDEREILLYPNSVDEYLNDLKNSEIISGYASCKGGKHGESIWTWVNFAKIDGRYYMYFEE